MEIATNEPAEQSVTELPSKLTVNDIDVDFLPLIYEIIRSVDREPHDSQKSGQPSDISQKILELHKKFELAREQVRRLPGVEYSKEEQLEKLETLRKQLRLKRELVLKTRLGEQAVDKLAETPQFRRAARLLVQLYLQSKSILPPDTPEKLKDSVLKSKQFQNFATKLKSEYEKQSKKFQ